MQVGRYAYDCGYEGEKICKEESAISRLQKSGDRLLHDVLDVLSDLSLLVIQAVKDVFTMLREIAASPYDGCFRRCEKWDFRVAIDADIESKWQQFASRLRKGAKFYETCTSSLFLTDVARANYYLGRVKTALPPSLKEQEGGVKEKSKEVNAINQQWVYFLKNELQRTSSHLKKTMSYAQFHLLRYELQDLANQRLFVLSEKLLEKASNNYKQAGFVLSNGAGTKAEDSIEYQLFVRDQSLVLRCNKIFSVHQSSTLKCFGYDGVSVDVRVDLEQFQPKAILTRQPAGCVQTSVKQMGFSPWFDKVESLMPK